MALNKKGMVKNGMIKKKKKKGMVKKRKKKKKMVKKQAWANSRSCGGLCSTNISK